MEMTETSRAGLDSLFKAVTTGSTVTVAESRNDDRGAGRLTTEDLRGTTPHSEIDDQTDLPSTAVEETN